MSNNTTVCFSYSNISNLDAVEKKQSFSLFLPLTWSASIAIAILSPVAVVGNALVLAAIWRNPSLRTPSYILLAGLAFTDLSTGLIAQPFYIAMQMIYLTDPLPKAGVNTPTSLIITAIASVSSTYFIYSHDDVHRYSYVHRTMAAHVSPIFSYSAPCLLCSCRTMSPSDPVCCTSRTVHS